MTQLFRSKWLNFLGPNVSTFQVKMTQLFRSKWLNFSGQNDSTFQVKMTQLFRSKWLNLWLLPPLTAVDADDEPTQDEHFVGLHILGQPHEEGPGDPQDVVEQQASFSGGQRGISLLWGASDYITIIKGN